MFNWIAFKTPKKDGVKGSFKDFGLKKPETAPTIDAYIGQTTFDIDIKSVTTKNLARDRKLAKHFFEFMGGNKIKGEFLSLKKKVLKTKITMNNKTLEVPLKVERNKQTLKATGTIDVFDFALNNQLSAINKACYKLHEGKTWNVVDLEVFLKFQDC
ncbi:MAG: YceI family protein [Bacteriovoracaceae bacterium]